MEYAVIILLLAVIVLMWFKKPNQVTDVVVKAVIKTIRESEPEIVLGVYNSLPKNIKEKVDSKVVADIVAYVIDLACDILEGTLER